MRLGLNTYSTRPLLSHLSQSSLLKLGLKGLPQVSHLSSGSNASSHALHVNPRESGSNDVPQVSHSIPVSISLSSSSISTECISQTKFAQSIAIRSQNNTSTEQLINIYRGGVARQTPGLLFREFCQVNSKVFLLPLVAPLKVFEENNFEKTLVNIGALGGT